MLPERLIHTCVLQPLCPDANNRNPPHGHEAVPDAQIALARRFAEGCALA